MANIRVSVESDAAEACAVLIRSITTLCVDDHHNDPTVLAPWLENKTVTNVRAWILSKKLFSVVAMDESGICGFGLISRSGEVLLCYVDPRARFLGVSTQLLECLELQAQSWGLESASLCSTKTAQRFYERRGYTPANNTNSQAELSMTKNLHANYRRSGRDS